MKAAPSYCRIRIGNVFRCYIYALICYFAIGNISAFAQNWVHLNTPLTGRGLTPYFIDQNLGFIYRVNSVLPFYRTNDGGTTWVNLGNISGNANSINQLYFISPSKGFAATTRGLYETNDVGTSWKKIFPNNLTCYSVYASGNMIYAYTLSPAGNNLIQLISSQDDGANWNVVFTGVFLPAMNPYVFGNKENIVYTEQFIAPATYLFWYSPDNGKTWNANNLDPSTRGFFSFPHCIDLLRTNLPYRTDYYPITHSGDYGANWNTLLPNSEIGAWIAGNACVLYVCNANRYPGRGLLRSTDKGQSWIFIPGPDFTEIDDADSHNLSVVGGGAVVYASDINGFIWKTTNGGDGKLSPNSTSKATITSDLQANTLQGSVCDTLHFRFFLKYTDCHYMSPDSYVISGLDSNEFSMSVHHHSDCSGFTDTVFVTVTPLKAGQRIATLNSEFIDDEYIRTTQLHNFNLDISPGAPVKLLFSAKNIRLPKSDTLIFTDRIFCSAGDSDIILLSNLSCIGLTIKDIRFESDSLTLEEFTVTKDIIKSSINFLTSGIIGISFVPMRPGIKKGNIIITTNIGSDTIPVRANVLRDAAAIRVYTEPVRAALCDSTESYLRFDNLSCRMMSLDSINLPAPFSIERGQLPVLLNPGGTAFIRAQFIPSQRGPSSSIARGSLRFFEPYDTTSFDTVLLCAGEGTHGFASLRFSAPSVNFDTIHICDSSKLDVTLYSVGCDSLLLDELNLAGDGDYSLTENGKRNIAPGDSIVLHIAWVPDAVGTTTSAIVVTLPNGKQIIVPINGTALRPLRILTCTAGPLINFGTQLTCKFADTSFIITNPSCTDVKVSGLKGLGSGFASSTKFPLYLASGGYAPIEVHTVTDTDGGKFFSKAEMEIISDADNTVAPVDLLHSYKYPYPIHLWLESEPAPKSASDSFRIFLKALPEQIANVNDISFSLSYHSDLISYVTSSSINSLNSSSNGNFHITGKPGIVLDANGNIAVLSFYVYLARDTVTPIMIHDLNFNNTDPNFTGCTVTPLSDGLDFNYVDFCGNRSLRTLLWGKPIDFSIRPNPVSGNILLTTISPISQDAAVEIFDALGVRFYSEQKNIPSGTNQMNIDTRNLPGGAYVARIHSAFGISSQNFIKVR